MQLPNVSHPVAFLAALIALASSRNCNAGFDVGVVFHDPGGAHAAYYADLRSAVEAAGSIWAGRIQGGGTLDVEVRFDVDHLGNNIALGAGGSRTTTYIRNNGTHNIFEPIAAHEVRTGVDVNGADPDVQFTFNTNYLQNELWFDPTPLGGSEAVPINKTDALTVMLHEFAHALGFDGWRNLTNGTLPGNYGTPFDELTVFDGTNYFFMGAAAMAVYGGPVPLTYGNIFHFGNNAPRPGPDLIPDLMNGVVFYSGVRYDPSPLDVAVLSDLGLSPQPAAVPEPSSFVLLGLVGVGYAGYRRRSRRRAA